MTIHKLNPDRAADEPRPFNVGMSFKCELRDLADVVIQTRAIQAFENAAATYPIHRLVRCSVKRKLEDVFDDLALRTGLLAQRLNRSFMLLDGPGVFVQCDGWRKAGYCSCTFNVWANTVQRADEIRLSLLTAAAHRFLMIADGVVRAQGRKIIFTTNLPNVRDIDEALLRPGRCFAAVETRPLKHNEAAALIVRLCNGDAARCEAAIEKLHRESEKSVSLAQIYRACRNA